MSIKFHHRGRYTADDFSIDEVIASLIAQKELIDAGLQFLSEVDPKFHYDGAKIRVESITTGTLGWDLLVEVYGKYQSGIETTVIGSLEEMFGVEIPAEYEGIVTLAVLAVTYMVARYAYERVTAKRGTDQPSIHIQGDNNVVIQQIAEVIGGDQDHVATALERSVPPTKRRRLLPKVADFLRPSRKQAGQKIELEHAPDISAETLAEFPSDADIQGIDESTLVDLPSALIDIRRLDRDKGSTGWAATILNDDRFVRRMPMDLYPTVDPEHLAQFQEVEAELVIECDRKADNRLKPKRIHLLSFKEPSDAISQQNPPKGQD